ncbi:hypothetical protein LINPERPRIM_LOCUS18715, partial [Linum perenne]
MGCFQSDGFNDSLVIIVLVPLHFHSSSVVSWVLGISAVPDEKSSFLDLFLFGLILVPVFYTICSECLLVM